MAYAKVTFENPKSGEIRVAPVGFSWTVFFFGFFPPMFRSDWKWAALMFLLALITSGISSIVFCFIYNKIYVKELIAKGFKAKTVDVGTLQQISSKLKLDLPDMPLETPA